MNLCDRPGDDHAPDLTSYRRASEDSRLGVPAGGVASGVHATDVKRNDAQLAPPTSRKGDAASIVQFDALSYTRNDVFGAKRASAVTGAGMGS